MAATNHNPDHKAVIDSMLLDLPGITPAKIFGQPCYKFNGTIFATHYGEGIGIKLPEARVTALLALPDFGKFQPFGRDRGPQFVQISHQDSAMYRQDMALFEESMAYAAATGKSTKTKPRPPKKNEPKAIEPEEMHFRAIAETLTAEQSAVTWGKMMSSPGIKYGDKFFAFYYNKGVVFRFGRDFAPESVGINNYTHLSPFKTKPPLRDWFCITADDQDRWAELANIAMQRMAENLTLPDTQSQPTRPKRGVKT